MNEPRSPSRRRWMSVPFAVLLSMPVAAAHAAGGADAPSSTGEVRSPTACGTTFSTVSTPNPGSVSNELSDVVQIATGDVWAVGFSNEGGDLPVTLAMHDDGTGWALVGTPNGGDPPNGILASVDASAGNDVWSVGSFTDAKGRQQPLVERWEGSSWDTVHAPGKGRPKNGEFNGLDVRTATDAWAVGSFTNKRGIVLTLAERWNGASWTIVPTPNPSPPGAPANGGLGAVYALSATNAWAVGSFLDASALSQPLVEHWNGSTWSIVATPDLHADEAALVDVTAVTSTAVWAVGFRDTSTLVERWSGSSWAVVPSPTPGTHAIGDLAGITVIKTGDLWAAGAYVTDAGALGTLVEHWNGSAWSIAASQNLPNGDNRLSSIDGNTTEVWAVGNFIANDGPPGRTIAMHRCPG